MKRLISVAIALLVITVILLQACTNKQELEVRTGYPPPIERIMLTHCAVKGCHDSKSAEASSGLDLSTWEAMFKGNRGGAVVIPFWHDLSTLFIYTNVHKDLGLTGAPTMPLNAEPLSRGEIIQLRGWIDNGARNANGFVKFSNNSQRSKYYIVNQGCDIVTVIDRETQLAMRYVQVGNSANIESPHKILVSPDKKYWYVIFLNSDVVQKYSTIDDSFVGECTIGFGAWNTFVITPDSRYAFIDDFASGNIKYVDLENMQVVGTYTGFNFPHGTIITTDNILYVLDTPGSRIFKLDVTDPFDMTYTTVSLPAGTNPHEIMLSPDGKRYFITAQGTNEVLIFDAATDAIISKIPVGTFPQEMTLSEAKNLLFVTCMEDRNTFPGKIGSVAIIDINTNTFVKSVYTGFQPHGILADDMEGFVLVANRNVSTEGSAPHHSSACGGRNGTLSFIDLNTMNVRPEMQQELSVDPYSIAIR